jgi:mono/diheme cytochrome c family protein
MKPKRTFSTGLRLASMVGIALLAEAAIAAPSAALDPKVQAYFEQHCLKCHDADAQKGDFRIDNLSPKVGFENTPQWLEIMERINSGEMPPKKEKSRPTAGESAQVVEWIAARMTEGESARLAARARVSYNRLTREEYVNTVRDLIGVHFDAADPGGLLEDEDWHGFERIGSVLNLSPSTVEKYFNAAEVVLAEAYPPENPKPIESTFRAVEERSVREPYRADLEARGLLDKLRFEMWPRDSFRGSARENLPVAGIYEISYTLSGLKPVNGLAPRLKVVETSLDRVLFEQDIVAPEDKPVTVTFQAHLPKGRPQIMVFNDLPGPSNTPLSGRHGGKPFVSIAEGRIPWQIKLTDEQGAPRYPFLILDSVSWRGPIISEQEQIRRVEYWPREEGNLDAVREGLERMASRAFRRPVTPDELNGYVGIVRAELEAGEKFRDAVKAGMLAILCSKNFLFMAEGDEDASRNDLSDWEIASRLSYLLWSTMPDDELFSLAEAGKLRDRAELARQVARMLSDPRAARFSDSFSRQWLRLRQVGRFPPDKMLYPDYNSHLEQSMIAETKDFFHEVLHGGLTLREFLDSDWSMMNPRLAKFYGLPDIEGTGDEPRRVTFPPNSNRGGLLTQASILSLTSDGTRHRPVHRGVWLSEAIFGKSPPPPPANVDPIAPNPVDSPKATLRMKLEAHIKDPNCASCHAKIDPLGLAFENYDAIGRWRTVEKTEGAGDDPPVNPAGKLPDGRAYQTPDEFKKLLLGDIDTFNAAFIEKLATYGLRRSMSFDDREQLKSIAAASKAKDYRLKDLIEAFVTSDLFQTR